MSLTTVQSGMVQQLASSNMPTGSVIQVVSSTVNTNASTTSTSFVTTGISVSITPKFSNSKVLLRFAGGQMDVGNGRQQMSLTFYRNSTNLAPSGGAQNYGFCCILLTGPSSFELQVPAAMEYLDSPATTSAITYSVYFISNSGGTVYLSTNGNSMTLTAQEIAG